MKIFGLVGWLVLGLALVANAQTLATSGKVSTTAGPAELTARYLIGSDGEPDGMMSEATRIIHVRVP